jgi:hypothetical protein
MFEKQDTHIAQLQHFLAFERCMGYVHPTYLLLPLIFIFMRPAQTTPPSICGKL